MTETEWLNSTDPIAMVDFLRGSPTREDAVTWWKNKWQTDDVSRGGDRKFRLFACACCRRIWDQIPMQCNREAVAAVEDWLEARLTGPDLRAALEASSTVEWNEDGSKRSEPGYWAVKYLGRGFYKLTAAASSLVVASTVMFMADDEYGSEARLEFFSSFYTGAGVFLRPFNWPLPIPAGVQEERLT
jgi:hypothetical protein